MYIYSFSKLFNNDCLRFLLIEAKFGMYSY